MDWTEVMSASPCKGWTMQWGYRVECGLRTRDESGFCPWHRHQIDDPRHFADREDGEGQDDAPDPA